MVQNSRSFDHEATMSKPAKREEIVYLNNAGQAWLHPEVEEVGKMVVSRPPWEMHADEDQKRIRQLFATLIEAQESDIAIMPSTAFATTFAARNVQRIWQEQRDHNTAKNKILLISDQMCSAVYAWQEFCDETENSLSLKIVPYPTNGKNWTQAITEELTDDVLVACLPPLHWSDGALIALEQIGQICRAKNVVFVVDATQAVGIMPCSVQEIQPDVLACSVHKWLRGPSGASLVYVRSDKHETWQPLDQHGRSRDLVGGSSWDASKNDMGPKGYPEKYFSDARKFDSGGKPNPIILPMLRKSMEIVVQNVNLNTAQTELKEIMKPVVEWAMNNGFSLTPGPLAWHLVGLRNTSLTAQQMLDVCSRLQGHNIFIAVRCGAFRISPYLDTTRDEIARLIRILSGILKET